MERTLKWLLLLPILLLRKSPSNTGTRAKELKSLTHRRIDQHDSNDWRGLIADYERDTIAAPIMHMDDSRTSDIKDEAKIRRTADLLSRYQCSEVRKSLLSNGLGYHNRDEIVEQMKWKYPK